MAFTSEPRRYAALLPSFTTSDVASEDRSPLHNDIELTVPTERDFIRAPTPLSRRNSVDSSKSETSSQGAKPKVHIKRLFSKYTQQIRQSRFHGWRMGVLLGCSTSAIVLCCNIAAVIAGGIISSGYQDGIANVMSGTSPVVSRWSTVSHILINAFSTILLAASNYTMQVLSSPTRHDIDAAHVKGQWVDIGLLSFHNLRLIPRTRAIVCFVLAFSSIPLHLFYNAAVFQVIADNEYNILIMDHRSEAWQAIYSSALEPNASVSNRTNDWFDLYNTEYVSGHGDLYLAIDLLAFHTQERSTTLDTTYLPLELGPVNQSTVQKLIYDSPRWINYTTYVSYWRMQGSRNNVSSRFNDSILVPTKLNMSQPLYPITVHVEHAISKTRHPGSRIQLSLNFMIIVIVFNALKLAVMLWVLVSDKSEYIVTLGDAVASFLERPEETTLNKCMLGKKEFVWRPTKRVHHHELDDDDLNRHELRCIGSWLPNPQNYLITLPTDRQNFFVVLCLLVVVANAVCPALLAGTADVKAWATASRSTLYLGNSILWAAWMVNSPQLFLSICYVGLNNVCTLIAGAEEWNNLPQSRKGLRVTRPTGEQRSTYFLQLPYKWAVPLAVASGTLHWLLSQSLFLVRVDRIDRTGEILNDLSKTGCGSSLLSFIVLLAVAFILLVAIGYLAARPMRPKLPIAASCSLAISAACHPPADETDTHLKKVMWGVVENRAAEGFEHCCLSAKKVGKPEVGKIYH